MRIYLWSALRIVDLRKGVFELKDWVPDKDILGSPLRYEGLNKRDLMMELVWGLNEAGRQDELCPGCGSSI